MLAVIWACSVRASAPSSGQLSAPALAFPKIRHRLLTFAGPTLLVVILLTWLLLLWIGFALITWPALGNSIQKSSGTTPTGFAAALYYSGFTLATLGYGEIVPQTGVFRVIAVVESLIEFTVLTLSLTYLFSVYSAWRGATSCRSPFMTPASGVTMPSSC